MKIRCKQSVQGAHTKEEGRVKRQSVSHAFFIWYELSLFTAIKYYFKIYIH